MVVVLFLGGVQLMSLGIIGEYLGRMFDETKRRPLYLINRFVPSNMVKDDHKAVYMDQESAILTQSRKG
jgi:hypothetical protein